MRAGRRFVRGVARGGLGVVLLGCVDRSVAGSGTSGGSETGGAVTSGSGTAGGESTGGGVTGTTGGFLGDESSTGTTGGVASSTTGGFVITPDYGPFGTIRCDLFEQDCAPGKKCAAWAEGGGTAWNATKCVDDTGDGKAGEPCTSVGGGITGIDDCAKGLMCWEVDEMDMGTCVTICSGSSDAPVCQGMTSCAVSAFLALCLPYCDPLIQDCDDGELCIADGGSSFLCVPDASGDMGAANDPCEFESACDPGLSCLSPADASSACMQDALGCCQPFCTFVEGQDGNCPNPDQKCVSWYGPDDTPLPGLEDVGICAIPP